MALLLTFVVFTLVLSTNCEYIDLIDEDFYSSNCETDTYNKKCVQPIFQFPNCVPWSTHNCDTTTKKKCTEYDCEVSLFNGQKLFIVFN